ncbi:diphthamide biosynthesis protein 2 [Kwoniella shandongensis]|uniref:2-(3-amino-3-carboxypropyl)histidine synthase subunit 2 n=1 Tax=Kwoniella shandongensis TaxID=1734106 RepID=A0A5M6BQI9_9TREE|nr:diphthamide biosynthesis protein 2 [Kwoniella shandongensis]KAA5525156.1 diphthamide biosynthesis protein 2 [Kwoniella shandongensis]
MSDLFSTPAEHALQHPELDEVLHNAQAGPSSMGDGAEGMSIEEAFEVEGTIEKILEGGYKTIGLQFPDELLPSSVSVYRAIQTRIQHTGAQAYVLADSTYGNCCPDILSCLHLPADFLVHYGHACLTPTDALPVHYVFPRRKLDVEHAAKSLLESSADELSDAGGGKKGVVVVWDVAYDWIADHITETFSKVATVPIAFAAIQRPSTAPVDKGKGKSPALRSIDPPAGVEMGDCVLWYIGEEGRACMNLQMTHASNPLFLYSPTNTTVTALHRNTSRLLSRRLFALHQALNADIFGLIVSNIGLASSKPLLAQLRSDLTKHKKKSYTLSVGRLNPAKLANFSEIECFVLVGCNEGGVVDQSKDFMAPIITPWELELALQGEKHVWQPEKWTLDLGEVLKNAQEHNAEQMKLNSKNTDEGDQDADHDDDDEDDVGPEFSLITGKMRTIKRFTNPSSSSNTGVEGIENGTRDLTLRNQNFTLAKLESAGSNFLASREFKGLEMRVGMDEPSLLEEGRSGVARGYTEEKK